MKTLCTLFLTFCCSAFICCTSNSNKQTTEDGTAMQDTAHNKKPVVIDSARIKARADSIADDKSEREYEATYVLANYLVNNAPANDVQVVDSDAAVFVFPDSTQLAGMKKETGDDFSTIADDASYYFSEDMQLFDSLKVKVVEPGKRYIKFVSKVKTVCFDTRAKASGGWITILFRTDSLPRIVNYAELSGDSALHCYFNRK